MQVPKAGPRFEDGPVCSCSSLLISGCQSHEYSQDSPKGGQLTLALLDVIKTWKKEYPEQDISSRYEYQGFKVLGLRVRVDGLGFRRPGHLKQV